MAILDQITIENANGIYAPREDSYLMCEAVEKYAKGSVLDLGCGSGILGIAAAMIGCKVTFADINRSALIQSKLNCDLNHTSGAFVLSDMFSSICGKFDTILFNPPYVPSERIDYIDLDGGVGGREVIDRFLLSYKSHINKSGIALLLESSANNFDKDVEAYGAEIVLRRHFFFEDLAVLLFK